MDEMKIKGPFFEKIAASILRRILAKNLGLYASNIQIKDLDISMTDTTNIKASIEVNLEKSGTELVKSLIRRKVKEVKEGD